MDLGTAGGNVATMHRSGGGGSTVNANSNVTINLDMRVSIASSSPAEAEHLVRMVGEKLQKDANLKRIASSL